MWYNYKNVFAKSLEVKMEKKLTGFCFTDIHNQQSMLDFPTTLRKSLVQAKELAVEEFGLADIALIGGDNISDYPYWTSRARCQ